MRLPSREEYYSAVSADRLSEVREVGHRLEQMVTRYDRLVRDLFRGLSPTADMQARVRLLNREVGLCAIAVQDLILSRADDGEAGMRALRILENGERAEVA